MPAEPARLRQVLYPSDDVERDTRFYAEALGLEPMVVDGSQFALLDSDGHRLALANPTEAVAGSTPAAVFAVGDVDSVVAGVVVSGGTVVAPPHDGPHERRAVLADPTGNQFIVYSR